MIPRCSRHNFLPPCLLLALAACGGEAGSAPVGRGLLVIAIDGLRADHLGLSGYDRATTPRLDKLAAEGIWFEQAFTAAPTLIPGHVAILTGCDPIIARRPPLPTGMFGSIERQWRIPAAVPTLARELLVAGFATAAFMDHVWLTPALGFDGGFEDYYSYREDVAPGLKEYGLEASATRFLRWLRRQDSDRDWFAYLTVNELTRSWSGSDPNWDTYFEPREELAYVPPVSDQTRVYFAIPRTAWPGGNVSLGEYEARYDGRIRRLDGLIQRIVGQLSALGRYDETTLCVVGTFGMGFGESGLILDHGTLSDVDLHVPLLIRPALSIAAERGRRSDALISTVDIAPTLLELMGIERPPGMHGLSQARELLGAGQPVRALAFARGGVQGGFAVRTPELSYEYVSPGGTFSSTLANSWFGGSRRPGERWREHLRDRGVDSGPGDLEPSADRPDTARELRAAGEEWYRWVDLARDALHSAPWASDPVSDDARAELAARGLIP